MSRDTAEAEAGMKGITFPAWHGKHYVTLAELLVRLGSFGLDLTWRAEFDEIVDPRCVEMASRSAGAGMDTLTLLSLTTPFLQLIDAEACGFAGIDAPHAMATRYGPGRHSDGPLATDDGYPVQPTHTIRRFIAIGMLSLRGSWARCWSRRA
jgi:hypothetical protein